MQLMKAALRNTNIFRMMSFYAVACGREVGIFGTWEKCEEQVKGFKGAKYKKFPTHEAATNYIQSSVPFAQVPQKRKANEEILWPEPKKNKTAEISEQELLKVTLEAEKQVKTTKLAELRANTFKHRSKIWSPVGVQSIGGYEFKIDQEGFVICYTDGSCINNGKKDAHAGFGVYFADDHPLNAAEPVKGRPTNNVGEIQAVNHAIKCAIRVGIPKLCVSTDSQFLLNSVISWIPGWKTRNWKLKDGTPVKNAAEFKELDTLLKNENLTVKWNYVKAHVGIRGNEMADELARQGSILYKLCKFRNKK